MSKQAGEKPQRMSIFHPSEEVHRVVIGAISDAVFITDDSGAFTYICPNVSNIFGRTFEEVAAMDTIEDLLGKGLPSAARLKKEGELKNLERLVTDEDGNSHTILLNVKRVEVERGTMLYTCRDITERKKMETAFAEKSERLYIDVVAARDRLRNLAHREVLSKERERARISRELHDETGQYLTALQIMAKVAKDKIETAPKEAAAEMNEAIKLIDNVSDRIRRIAQGLRPPAIETVGLNETLEGLCREVSLQASLPIAYTGETVSCLNMDSSITLYRLLQEGLTNVVRHAKAKRVAVRLSHRVGEVCLTLEDDGVGFDFFETLADGAGLGLLGMRERTDFHGGSMDIESGIGLGTSIRFSLPCDSKAGAQP